MHALTAPEAPWAWGLYISSMDSSISIFSFTISNEHRKDIGREVYIATEERKTVFYLEFIVAGLLVCSTSTLLTNLYAAQQSTLLRCSHGESGIESKYIEAGLRGLSLRF